jgi:alkaline phosphatase D
MQPQLLALVATWLLACGLCATDEETDAVYPAVLLERVAFGSCNKQNKTDLQSVAWASVAAFNPQLWLWTGDAVYSETRSVASLEAAFSQQLAVPSYRQFQATGAQIDGVWVTRGSHYIYMRT